MAYYKKVLQRRQVSTDGGQTWTFTGEEQWVTVGTYNTLEECNGASVITGTPEIDQSLETICVGTDEYWQAWEMVSYDGGTTYRRSGNVVQVLKQKDSDKCSETPTTTYTLTVTTNIDCDITINGITTSNTMLATASMNPGTNYTVSFSEKAGYITPSNITGVLNGDKTVSARYEEQGSKLTLSVGTNVNCDITISANTMPSTTAYNTRSTSVQLDSGSIYKVSVSDVAGYTKPNDVTGTITASTSLTLTYTASSSNVLAILKVNGNSNTDVEITGTTGEITRSMVSAYTGTAYSVQFTTACTSIGESTFSGFTVLSAATTAGGGTANTITSIGDYAFKQCTNLKNFSGLGSRCTSIGKGCFDSCTNLLSVQLNRTNITSIPESAFTKCLDVYVGTMPDTVTSIGTRAFYGNTHMASITIPLGVTSIGTSAFSGCTSFTSIDIKATIPPTLGNNAFAETNDCPIYVPCDSVNAYKSAWSTYRDRIVCKQLLATTKTIYGETYEIYGADTIENIPSLSITSSVTVTTACTSIGGYSFKGGTALTQINFSNTVKTIEEAAFSGCTNLSSVTIPNSVTTIEGSVFSDCGKLTSVTFGNSIISIGADAFNKCSGLTSVSIPNSVTTIDSYAFEDCSRLTSVTIGNGITYIGDRAFLNDTGLTFIRVNATVPPTLGTVSFVGTNNCPIYVPCASLNNYKTAAGWSEYESRITCNDGNPKAVLTLNNGTTVPIYGSGALTRDEISGYSATTVYADLSNCTEIGNAAFSGFTSLTGTSHFDSMVSIGHYAFARCTALTSTGGQTIGENLTSLGEGAFLGTKIGGVDIPTGVTTIGNAAFSGCSNLRSVTLHDNITSIENHAFESCDIGSIVLPNSLTEIGTNAFVGNRITEIDLKNIQTIGSGAFAGNKLTNLYIPCTVGYIDTNAFGGNTGLTAITFGLAAGCDETSQITLNTFAFQSCESLKEIHMENPVYTPIHEWTTNFHDVFLFCHALFDGSGKICLPSNQHYDPNSSIEEWRQFATDNNITMGVCN